MSVPAPAPKPGGQDAVTLKRLPTLNGTVPEFTEVQVLPGRGMDVLSIKAYLPGKGEISILSSPEFDQIAPKMTGKDADANGEVNMEAGGAFLAPFTNPIAGNLSADGKSILVNLHGDQLTLPALEALDGGGGSGKMARYGLLNLMSTSQVLLSTMPDGGEAKATYDSGDFGGRWPGKLQMTISATLSGRAVDLNVSARNDSGLPVPVGIGWYPRFAIPSGNRAKATLRLPIGLQLQESEKTHSLIPSIAGRIAPENGYNVRGGQALGSENVQGTYVAMKPALFDNGPTVELRDPESDYGLKVVAMSSSIDGLRISAPANKNFVVISPRANMTDPTGKPLDADKAENLMLAPGKTLQWRVRIELFAPSMQKTKSTE